MQNNPSQVQNWTQASCRMVRGISRIDAKDRAAPAGEAPRARLHFCKIRQIVRRIFLRRDNGPKYRAQERRRAKIKRKAHSGRDNVVAAGPVIDPEDIGQR